MANDKFAKEECGRLAGEAAREVLSAEGDHWEDIQLLKEYINRLEAERDYYQRSSEFAGVPNTPRPELIKD